MPLLPYLYPPTSLPLSLCENCTLPLRPLPPPLEVDELIHQQKGAGQVGDVGLWTATVAARVTTWNMPERERDRDRDGHGRTEGDCERQAKEKIIIMKIEMEKLGARSWWGWGENYGRAERCMNGAERETGREWAGVIFVQLHHYRGRVRECHSNMRFLG